MLSDDGYGRDHRHVAVCASMVIFLRKFGELRYIAEAAADVVSR